MHYIYYRSMNEIRRTKLYGSILYENNYSILCYVCDVLRHKSNYGIVIIKNENSHCSGTITKSTRCNWDAIMK